MNGKEVVCRGVSTVMVEICGRLLRVEAIVMNEIIESVDVIRQLGRVAIYENDAVELRGGTLCSKYATNSNHSQEQLAKSV